MLSHRIRFIGVCMMLTRAAVGYAQSAQDVAGKQLAELERKLSGLEAQLKEREDRGPIERDPTLRTIQLFEGNARGTVYVQQSQQNPPPQP